MGRKEGVYWLSDKIIRTAYITQRAVGEQARGPLNDNQKRERLLGKEALYDQEI